MNKLALSWLLSLSVALAGLGLFVAASLSRPVEAEDPAPSAEVVSLRERIQALEEETARLSRMPRAGAASESPARVERHQAAAPDVPEDGASRKAGSARPAAGASDAEELIADAGTASPVEKEHFRLLLDEVRAEERKEAEQKRRERDLKNIRRRVEGYAEKLALSTSQVDDMAKILARESDAMREVFSGSQDGEGFGGPGFGGDGDRTATFEKMRKVREERETALSELLDAGQLEQYAKLEQESRGQWGRGPGGRGGDSGGRGGDSGGRGGSRESR